MLYNFRQAFKNMRRNMRLTLASIVTIAACIFLFCLFFCIVTNLDAMVKNIETKVGITVFFREDLSQERIQEIGQLIKERPEVREAVYTSAQEAWDTFKADYFAGHEELAEGFEKDNPLKGSSSYSIFLNDAGDQDGIVAYLESIDGVRQVNYSSAAASALTGMSRVIGTISLLLITILLAVAVFLISNTISVAAAFKKNEIAIMRLIGASNMMIRAPFLIEGIFIGLVGALIPLATVGVLYARAVLYLRANYAILTDVVTFIPITDIMPLMTGVAAALGVGLGAVVSFVTMRRYLKV